jgi:hypothetical protein
VLGEGIDIEAMPAAVGPRHGLCLEIDHNMGAGGGLYVLQHAATAAILAIRAFILSHPTRYGRLYSKA